MTPEEDRFQTYRKYAQHEDDLIHQRSSWMYLIQSFLVATYGFTIQKKLEVFGNINTPPRSGWTKTFRETVDQVDLFLNIISYTGVAVGIVGGVSILAAFLSIVRLEQQWNDYANEPTSHVQHLPGLTGGGSRLNQWLGIGAGLLFPILLIIMWFVLLRLSISVQVMNSN